MADKVYDYSQGTWINKAQGTNVLNIPSITNQGAAAQPTLGQVQPSPQNTSYQPTAPQFQQAQNYANNPGLAQSQTNMNNQFAKTANYDLQQKQLYNESFMGQAEPYIKNGAAVIQGITSLASIYMGNEQLKLARKGEKRADEAWQEQKRELAHVRGVRKRLTSQYMA